MSDEQKDTQDSTNQGMRAAPEQAADAGMDVSPDSNEAAVRPDRDSDEHLANRERGGTIAGGGSRDE